MKFYEACEILNEEDLGLLYHFTNEENFLKILKDGYLKGSKYQINSYSFDNCTKSSPSELCMIRGGRVPKDLNALSNNVGTIQIVLNSPSIQNIRNIKKPNKISEIPLLTKAWVDNSFKSMSICENNNYFRILKNLVYNGYKKVSKIDFQKLVEEANLFLKSINGGKIKMRIKPSGWRTFSLYEDKSKTPRISTYSISLKKSMSRTIGEEVQSILSRMQTAVYYVLNGGEGEERFDLSKVKGIPVSSKYMKIKITKPVKNEELKSEILKYKNNDKNLFYDD